MRVALQVLAAACATAVALGSAGSALAGDGHSRSVMGRGVHLEADPGYRHDFEHAPKSKKRWRLPVPAQPQPTGTNPPLGTVRQWLALDVVDPALQNPSDASLYLKAFTLRALGPHVELWVANDLSFPAGDCRNGVRTEITDAQAQSFVTQFETTIYPRESLVFRVPPPRDGSGSPIDPNAFAGLSTNVVVLVDNIRDPQYYDADNAQDLPYIAGFFDAGITELTDRNVVTSDAYDWLHRTGENPPNDPHPGDPCANAPARPNLYEANFAHEYQHLLEYYSDPDEVDWVNEGLAEWAQTLTGFQRPATPITQLGFNAEIQCFQGWLSHASPANPSPLPGGGPQNSLTLWGDGDHILCEYGAVYSFMQLLADRYGIAFMAALHREPANGLVGLQEVLDRFGVRQSAQDLIHDWAAMTAVDAALDDGGKLQTEGRKRDLQAESLHSSVDWDSPDAYATPGAAPNGSDFVLLRDAAGHPLTGAQLQSLSFDGATTLPSRPVEWTLDGGELASGSGDLLDRGIVRSVSVPASGDRTLTFSTRYAIEPGFDFGFVQVSTDGGRTYTSLGNADTTSAAGAYPPIAALGQGFTGDSGGTRSESFDLSPYAGQTILLAFRYTTDPAVAGPGWWIDDVAVGGVLVADGSTLAGWQSPSEVFPTPVAGFTVQLVSIGGGRRPDVQLATLRLDSSLDASLSARDLRKQVDPRATTVAAIVTFDDPTETADRYAPYGLVVNGVLQPGGS